MKECGCSKNTIDMIFIVPTEIVLNKDSDIMFREKNIENIETQIKALPTNFFKMRFFRENIGVSVLNSYLSKFNYNSKIFYMDEYVDKQFCLIDEIMDINPAVIGISIMYNLHLISAIQITNEIRRRGYSGHIVYGGPCATLLCDKLLSGVLELDSVALGEGENTLKLLIEYIKEKKNLSNIPGLATRVDGKIQKSSPVIVENLDDIPFANRDYLQIYKDKLANMMTVCSIYTSRGCAGKCTFCSAPQLGEYSSIRWRFRSVDNLLDEMSMLVEKFGIKYFDIIDENFFGYGAKAYTRLEDFVKGVNERGLKIRFRGEIRADANINYDILFKLKSAGLTDILLGIESGSQKVLNRWQKGTQISKVKSVISLVQSMGFNLDPAFIMVDPFITVDEFIESVDFIIDSKIYNCEKPLYLFNEMILFPGTRIYEEFLEKKKNNISTKESIISIMSSQQEIENFCKNISFCEYTIEDKYVQKMWSILKKKVNELTCFVESDMPLILSSLNQIFSQQNREGKEKIISIIRQYNNWLKSLNELTKELLLCSKKYLLNEINDKQYELDMQKCINYFSYNFLGEKIENYINNCNSIIKMLN